MSRANRKLLWRYLDAVNVTQQIGSQQLWEAAEKRYPDKAAQVEPNMENK